jgi:glycosyltransferase involved in cell wall biosynthesis
VSLPLVSILIPTYNSEQWVAQTIRSALGQTWQSKEIIIVDDGSTDRTLQVARQFESESVRVFSQQNQGAAAARNKAFSLSQGDYIQWLDADDLLAADKIARQMEVVGSGESPRTLLSSPWGPFTYRVHRAEFTPNALWCDLSPAEFLVRKLGQKIFMQTAVWLVSRELSEAAGPWDVSLVSDDDGEYFCRVMLASTGIRFVPDAKVYYRRVGTGRLSYVGRADNKLEALWRSMQLHIGYLRSLEDSERVRAACMQYLQNYIVVFYGQRPDIVDQMHEVARGLGGALQDPRLPWKYAWIKSLFGWSYAKRAQLFFPSVKWSVLRSLDRVQFSIEEKFLAKDKGLRFQDGGVASKSPVHTPRQQAEVKPRRKSGS